MNRRIATVDAGPASRQRGIATLIALVALVMMALVVLALVRSSDTSTVIAGNIAFRRDLTNQAQRVIPVASTLFSSGALAGGPSSSTRWGDVKTSNYFAETLASNNQGIPNILLNDNTFTGTAGDITDTTAGVTIRYAIDRLCTNATPGTPVAPTAAICVQGFVTTPNSGTAGVAQAGSIFIPAYRLSIRVTGPRETQAFVQVTLQVN